MKMHNQTSEQTDSSLPEQTASASLTKQTALTPIHPQITTPERSNKPARKRLFIGLICATSALLSLIFVLGWGIPYIGLGNIHPYAPYITGLLLAMLILLLGWAALSLVLQVITGKVVWGTGKSRAVTVKVFLPLMEFLGKLVRIPSSEVRRSFIEVNNQLVRSSAKEYKPQELLLLLPHCIQWSECSLRVSNRIDRCKHCGNCNISDLLNLSNKYGINMAIATGGTIARKIVVEKRPKLIIAIACERDLSSGIQDTYPLQVYGVLNERPHGPCIDTCVSLQMVEQALQRFIIKDLLPE